MATTTPETIIEIDGYPIEFDETVGEMAGYEHVLEWARIAAGQLDYSPDMGCIESEDLSLTIEQAGDGFVVTSWFDVREDRGTNPTFARIYG